jgi:hypothetical protein
MSAPDAVLLNNLKTRKPLPYIVIVCISDEFPVSKCEIGTTGNGC